MNILVVPTIREDCAKRFVKEWYEKTPDWDKLLFIEDNPEKTFSIEQDNVHHYCWKDIEKDLGENAWIISRRDSAIKCYGFLKAFQTGRAGYTFCLDDDCYPTEKTLGNFCATHIKQIEQQPKWTTSIPKLRTRGLPYHNLGTLESVVANHGLWENVPDFDAPNQLIGTDEYFNPEFFNRVMPHGQYWPFCGMNFAFKREVSVLTYFPLMGKGSPYGRMDDIWFGVIFQRICDHLNKHITCGDPVINHSKASNVFKNLIKEAPGIEFNEEFWEVIQQIPFTSQNPKDCMAEVGEHLINQKDDYLCKIGKAIKIWVTYF